VLDRSTAGEYPWKAIAMRARIFEGQSRQRTGTYRVRIAGSSSCGKSRNRSDESQRARERREEKSEATVA